LGVRRHLVVAAGVEAIAREQELRTTDRKSMAGVHGDAHDLVAFEIEELPSVSGPLRPGAPLRRDLPLAAGPGKRTEVDLAPARLVRLVGDPTTVPRELSEPFPERGAHEGIGLAVPSHGKDPDVQARLGILLPERQ